MESNTLVHRPLDVARLSLKAVDELIELAPRALRTYTSIDNTLLGLRPRILTSVIALSSNWKTGFMQYVSRMNAAKLSGIDNNAIVYVTWETSIEELGLMDLAHTTGFDVGDIIEGRADMEKVRAAADERGAVPIYVIGHSSETRHARPNLSLPVVIESLKILERQMNIKPTLICLDYLQRIERDTAEKETRLQFMQNVERAKDMALILDCHVMLGVQAREEVSTRKIKLPRMGDAHEAPAALRHASDNVIGLWRPYVTEGNGGSVDVGGNIYAVTEDLLFASVEKQKFGRMGDIYPLSVDFATATVRGSYTAHTTATKG